MSIVHLNVGGWVFCTTRETLASSNSFFSGLVVHDAGCTHGDQVHEFFIDRDPMYFRYILNWLRGVRFLPDDDSALHELSFEADYYSMEDMLTSIRQKRTGVTPSLNVSLARIVSRI